MIFFKALHKTNIPSCWAYGRDNATTRERAQGGQMTAIFVCQKLAKFAKEEEQEKEKEKQSKKLGAFNEFIEPIGQVVNLRHRYARCCKRGKRSRPQMQY